MQSYILQDEGHESRWRMADSRQVLPSRCQNMNHTAITYLSVYSTTVCKIL